MGKLKELQILVAPKLIITRFLGDVDTNALLVPIDREKVSAFPGRLSVQERWSPRSGVVPCFGVFNFDDLRTEVSQDHSTVGSCQYS